MTTPGENTIKRSKRSKLKNKDLVKGEKRSVEDDNNVIKKKLKKEKQMQDSTVADENVRFESTDENIIADEEKVKKKEKEKELDVDFLALEKDDDNIDESTERKKLRKDKKKKKNKVTTKTSGENDTDQSKKNENENVENEDGKEETKKKGPSKRQIKREKALLREEQAKEESRKENATKALNYVSKWKHARSEWKFEKLKQIWLMDNLLNDKYVPDDHFPFILEYFEGCKGIAKKTLIEKAMKIIKKIEDNVEEDEESIETTEYKRARQLLQALPVEA